MPILNEISFQTFKEHFYFIEGYLLAVLQYKYYAHKTARNIAWVGKSKKKTMLQVKMF